MEESQLEVRQRWSTTGLGCRASKVLVHKLRQSLVPDPQLPFHKMGIMACIFDHSLLFPDLQKHDVLWI